MQESASRRLVIGGNKVSYGKKSFKVERMRNASQVMYEGTASSMHMGDASPHLTRDRSEAIMKISDGQSDS